MIGTQYSRITLLGLLVTLIGATSSATAKNSTPIVRGTINVVLANKNGIVAVTDSMQSYRDRSGTIRQLPEPGQKLFRLDDRTVCTIAGFGSAPLPAFPDFSSSAIEILELFKGNLEHSKPPLSFDDKLRALGFIFDFHLSVIANVRNENPPGDYYFELLMAGYDTDGTPRIGKLVLGMTLKRGGIFSPVVTTTEGQTVGFRLVHYLAGQPTVAQSVLDHPAAQNKDPVVRKYAQAKSRDGGKSLSLAELKDLAIFLVHKTAVGNPTVGGKDQVAVLFKSSIQSFDQPDFSQQATGKAFTPGFTLLVQIGDSGGRGELIGSVYPMIFIKSKIDDKSFYTLDGKHFFRSEIVNSHMFYDGGAASLDQSNRVTGSVLMLGPHANKNPQAVAKLKSNFHWAEILDVDQDGKPRPAGESSSTVHRK